MMCGLYNQSWYADHMMWMSNLSYSFVRVQRMYQKVAMDRSQGVSVLGNVTINRAVIHREGISEKSIKNRKPKAQYPKCWSLQN